MFFAHFSAVTAISGRWVSKIALGFVYVTLNVKRALHPRRYVKCGGTRAAAVELFAILDGDVPPQPTTGISGVKNQTSVVKP